MKQRQAVTGQAQRGPTYRARNGKTTEVIYCQCGWDNEFYPWSWAGHGKARCKGCGCWIAYYTLECFTQEEVA